MFDAFVVGSFYSVVVVSAAFDDSRVGAVTAFWVWTLVDLVEGFSDRFPKALRGKSPPGW